MDLDTPEMKLLFTKLASQIHERGLSVPAIFILELYKPIVAVFNSACYAGLPLLAPLFGARTGHRVAALLESRDGLERLIVMLEELVSAQGKGSSATVVER